MAKKEKKDNKEKKNNFFKEVKVELKKVTWPTPKKLVNDTSAVVSIVLIVALIVFLLDVCFENLNKFGVGKLKELVASDTEVTEEAEDETDADDDIELITDEDEADGLEVDDAAVTTEDTAGTATEETDAAASEQTEDATAPEEVTQ